MQQYSLNDILVIDEMPIIAVGLQEIFRALHPSSTVESSENIYAALSSPRLEGKTFDLIVLGSFMEDAPKNLPVSITELKGKFGNSRLMLYTTVYDPALLAKMEVSGIDAYIHKYEAIIEIRNAYLSLSRGERYISGMLYTLFYDFQLDNSTNSHLKEE